jgi:hypothetical protein
MQAIAPEGRAVSLGAHPIAFFQQIFHKFKINKKGITHDYYNKHFLSSGKRSGYGKKIYRGTVTT